MICPGAFLHLKRMLFGGVQGVAVVQRAIRGEEPAEAMRGMGFGDLTLVDTFAVTMSGEADMVRRLPQCELVVVEGGLD